ncbi:MAG: DUF3179 domain-containing protein [Planctomycetales bacterium]|nr:DUF3179 domain-containing protein [bacterium]UNM07235.1 MAG: DUF3179 domain-containing protein [Planctomycetales bacterium]
MSTEQDNSGTSPEQGRTLEVGGLWWLWLLVIVAMLAMLIRILLPVAQQGLGSDPAQVLSLDDYGYDTANQLPGSGVLTPSGLKRDQIRALSAPPVVAGSEVPAINKQERRLYHRKFIVSGDRVVGVSLNGEERAYQINILNYHEIVNDELGGVPIAIVYSPLCDAATVFRRDVSGNTLEFGSSGLLINSNIVMYDRQDSPSQSSLWSQLQLRSVAGPKAGTDLQLVPSALTHWGDWVAAHPQTTLMARETGEPRDYNTNPYLRYFEMGELRFPVEPLPPAGGMALMDRVIAIRSGDGWNVYSFDNVKEKAGESGAFGWQGMQFSYIPYSNTLDPPGVVVTDDAGNYLDSISTFWFAWYAMHPDSVISSLGD